MSKSIEERLADLESIALDEGSQRYGLVVPSHGHAALNDAQRADATVTVRRNARVALERLAEHFMNRHFGVSSQTSEPS